MPDEADDLRAAIAAAEHAHRGLGKQRELVDRLRERVELYRDRLARERRDVERLEGPGLAAFLRTLLGDRDRELDRERREVATAAILHDEARTELVQAAARLAARVEVARELPALRARLTGVLRERSGSGAALAPDETLELRRLELHALCHELREAEQAASAARESLDGVIERLDRASALGAADLFVGGVFISAWKHGRIAEAQSRLATAQIRLRVLARELEDLSVKPLAELEIAPLTRFTDVFLDNLFSDWAVQRHVHRAREHVRELRGRVDRLQLELRERLRHAERELRSDATRET